MSRILSELLEAKEPTFSQTIRELEIAGGLPNVDIRLAVDIEHKVHNKLKELGLDPTDTTSRELYQSLQDLIKIHDLFLAKALGVSDPTDVEELVPKLIKVIKTLPVSKSCWALKHNVARRLLKEQPPKKVMKQLSYRSIDSMLKREQVSELFAAARVLESPLWQKKLVKSYTLLSPSDFEIRNMEISMPSSKEWQGIGEQLARAKHHTVVELREMGAVVVLPMPIRQLKGASITLLSLLLHHINEVRIYSTFFKMQQVKPQFGSIISDVLLHDTPNYAHLAGQQLHWRVLHRYFGRKPGASSLAIFEPHVQLEDLEWRQAEAVLYRIEPALKFWENLDFAGTFRDGKPVSLNLLDNAINYCNGLLYGQQTATHMKSNLWDEIYLRYLEQERIESDVMLQLDNQVSPVSKIEIFADGVTR